MNPTALDYDPETKTVTINEPGIYQVEGLKGMTVKFGFDCTLHVNGPIWTVTKAPNG